MGNISSAHCPFLSISWHPSAWQRSARALDLDAAHPQGNLPVLSRMIKPSSGSGSLPCNSGRMPGTGPRLHVLERKMHEESLAQAAAKKWVMAAKVPASMVELWAPTFRPEEAAAWRHRMHAVRRRLILKVRVLVRLTLLMREAGMRQTLPPPAQLVPLVLRSDLAAFAQVQRVHHQLLQELEGLRDALDQAKHRPQPGGSAAAASPLLRVSRPCEEVEAPLVRAPSSTTAKPLTPSLARASTSQPLEDSGGGGERSSASRPRRASATGLILGRPRLGSAAGTPGRDSGSAGGGAGPQGGGPPLQAAEPEHGDAQAVALPWSTLLHMLHAGGSDDALRSSGTAPGANLLQPRSPGAAPYAAGNVADSTLRPRATLGSAPLAASASADLSSRITQMRARLNVDTNQTVGDNYIAASHRRSSMVSLSGTVFNANGDRPGSQPLSYRSTLPAIKGSQPSLTPPATPPAPHPPTTQPRAPHPPATSRGGSLTSVGPRPAAPARPTPEKQKRVGGGPAGQAAPPDYTQPGYNGADSAAFKVALLHDLSSSTRLLALQRYVVACEAVLRDTVTAMEACVTRANCEWADRRDWKAPHIDDTPSMPSWAEHPQHLQYHSEALRLMRLGSVAVQVLADSDAVLLPSGELQDLWSADPWLLAAICAPDAVPNSEADAAKGGLSLGTRILLQLVAHIEALTGAETAARLNIIVHLTDPAAEQREQLEADIAEHAIYGKLADRLMFCFHQSQHSFRYRHDIRRFAAEPGSPLLPLGSGLSMLQLCGPGDALTCRPGPQGLQLEPLKSSVLDVLASRNVEWLLSWRSRDAALLSPDPAAGPFDPAMLSYALWTQHMKKANCTLQASVTKSYTAASLHQHGSVLLQPGLRWADEPAAEGHGGLVPDLNISSRRHREAVTRLLASKIGQQLDLEPLVELAAAETQSAHMTAALAAAQQSMFNQWAVGLARYTWHLPSLKAILGSKVCLRPALHVSDGQLRVQLDAAPLTCNPRCRMVGLSAREAVPKVVFAGPDTAAWVPLLRAQDHSLAKAANVATPGPSQKYTLIRVQHQARGSGQRRMNMQAGPAAAAAVLTAALRLCTHSKHHAPVRASVSVAHSIVVLLADNNLAENCLSAAALVARPGLDRVVLLQVVPAALGPARAERFLEAHAECLRSRGLKCNTHVLLRDASPLTDLMRDALSQYQATLLVLGSLVLTHGSGAAGSNPATHSFTHFVLRSFALPLLLVTQHCKLPPLLTPQAALAEQLTGSAAVLGSGSGSGGLAGNRPGGAAAGAGDVPAAPAATKTVVVVVEGHSRPLMRYMAGLLTPQQKGSKGDKLVLTQVLNLKACKPQLVSSMRTVLDKFLALAESEWPSYSLRDVVIQHLEPPFDRALLSAIKAEAAQLLAVQMPRLAGPGPAGTGGSSATPFAGSSAGSHGLLPPQLLSVIRGATVPLLIYPDRHVEIGQDAWGHRHLVVNTSSLTNGSGAHIATTTSRMGLAQV
ncbi:hypothetical protein QJQ45_022360 [Haematococcus lacustris]|nr:hypothetical protein QJQ45_022360 [Haematococcus lacustris]